MTESSLPSYVLDGRSFRLRKNMPCSFHDSVASGNYENIHNVIIEPHFPECGSELYDHDFSLITFPRDVQLESVLPLCAVTGFTLGTMDQLNELNRTFPALLDEGPIIAAGSAWADYRVVTLNGTPSPTITTYRKPLGGNYKTLYTFAERHVQDGRRLALCAYIQKHSSKTRFLVYRKD